MRVEEKDRRNKGYTQRSFELARVSERVKAIGQTSQLHVVYHCSRWRISLTREELLQGLERLNLETM